MKILYTQNQKCGNPKRLNLLHNARNSSIVGRLLKALKIGLLKKSS